MATNTSGRRALKQQLARFGGGPARGVTTLIYHRVGGGTRDERDLAIADFTAQMDLLADHDVVAIGDAITGLEARDDSAKVVLTFDDGFADVHATAWPLLRERQLPFTIYLATAYVGGTMHWDGSTASAAGPALTWPQLREMVDSGLCTIGNHTHTHARPELLTDAELEECSATIEARLDVIPEHFAYTWGVPVPRMEPALRGRFRSSATGELGRGRPSTDLVRLPRVPVRLTDPLPFFAAKLAGNLGPERTYGAIVAAAKKVGLRA